MQGGVGGRLGRGGQTDRVDADEKKAREETNLRDRRGVKKALLGREDKGGHKREREVEDQQRASKIRWGYGGEGGGKGRRQLGMGFINEDILQGRGSTRERWERTQERRENYQSPSRLTRNTTWEAQQYRGAR